MKEALIETNLLFTLEDKDMKPDMQNLILNAKYNKFIDGFIQQQQDNIFSISLKTSNYALIFCTYKFGIVKHEFFILGSSIYQHITQ